MTQTVKLLRPAKGSFVAKKRLEKIQQTIIHHNALFRPLAFVDIGKHGVILRKHGIDGVSP